MSRVSKEVSTRLFKYVKRIDISFNPFDARARSAREFMNLTSAERIRVANPNLEIKPNIVNTANAPKVSFEFIDGNKQEIDSQGFVASEILQELHMQASQIENKFELEGKEI